MPPERKDRPEISVIVPIYRVEMFLPRCIDSILKQTFRDIEVILVDDGSDDGCPAICDAAAEKDARVRVIHQKNQGLSAARNAGIGAAYMLCRGFVDNGILGFVGGGLLYTVIFAAIALVLYGRTPEFKYFMQMMAKRKKK